MFLFIQLWEFKDSIRQKEIYNVLLKNCQNKFINKIIVFVENNTQIYLNHNKIKVVKVKNRLSYQYIFNYAKNTYKNDICIVSNADIIFDNTVSNFIQNKNINKSYALSSYRLGKLDTNYNIDSFVFNSKFIKVPGGNDLIGENANIFLNKLSQINSVINPSLIVKTQHLDSKCLISKRLRKDSIINFPQPCESMTVGINETINKRIIPINNNEVKVEVKPKLNKKNIAIIIHLYYQDLLDEFLSYLSNINKEIVNYDIYVTITKNSSTKGQEDWIFNKLNNLKNVKCFITENKGLDIGPFLKVIEYIHENNLSDRYDYILKLHSKKSIKSAADGFGDNWRKELIQPLIGNKEIFDRNIFLLNNKYDKGRIGMLGAKKWVIEHTQGNEKYINYYRNRLNITIRSGKFVGGTMFWISANILFKYFNKSNISNIYNELENGYFLDHDSPKKTHSLERIFGHIVSNDNYLIIGV